MTLTAAERAKRYREKKKQDPETYLTYFEKERNRHHDRRARGDFKISNMSQRAQNYQRRRWKLKQRKRREKKRLEQKGTEFMNLNSPTASPTGRNEIPDEVYENQQVDNAMEDNRNHAKPAQETERSKQRRNRNRIKSYRKVKKLEDEKKYYKALWETVRKSNQRLR